MQPRVREARGPPAATVESAWSPIPPTRRFGVHLASKTYHRKSFVFIEDCL
jgi:hypothetical protein